MISVQFKRTAISPLETYKDDYTDPVVATADSVWLLANGYWYDDTGTYFPPLSLFSTNVKITTIAGDAMGVMGLTYETVI